MTKQTNGPKETKSKRSLQAAAIITGMIAISKIIGYLREAVVNATFGQSAAADAYTNANTILSMFTLLFSSGIASTFIPIYTKEKLAGGFQKANRYANNVVNLYIIVSVAATVLAAFVFTSPQFLGLFYQKNVELIAPLARILCLSIAFSAVWGVLCNVLNANERFIPETLQGYILSACIIFACLQFGDIRSLTIATALAPVFQLLSLVPSLRGVYRYQPRLHLNDSNLRRTFWLAMPAMIAMEFDTINNFVDTIFANAMIDGSARILKNCYSIVILLQGIFVVPLTTVSYPRLSRSAGEGDTASIVDSIKQTTEMLAAVLFPIIGIIVIMRTEVFAILFQHGEFTAEGTARAALPLACYVIGVFGFGLRNYQSRVFYALQRTWPPMLIGMCMVVLTIVLDFLFVRVFDFGLAGLTLATSMTGSLGAMIMLITLRRYLGRMKIKAMLPQLARTLLATAVGVVMTLLVRNLWVAPAAAGFVLRLARLFVCGMAGLLGYLLAAKALRVQALQEIISLVWRRRRR